MPDNQLAILVRMLVKENIRLRYLYLREKRLGRIDALTGVLSRRAIELVAAEEIRRRNRYVSPLTVALIDVDQFKSINDQFLYTGGDRVLIGLAQALNTSCRQTDRVGRLGGDEFLIVAPQTDSSGAASLAERIHAQVQTVSVCYDGQLIPLTVSVGLAVADGAMIESCG